MNKLKQWVSDILSEPNGKTVCVVRALAIIGFLYAIVTHAWSVYGLHITFDLQSFGMAYGTMIAGLGAALGLKTNAGE